MKKIKCTLEYCFFGYNEEKGFSAREVQNVAFFSTTLVEKYNNQHLASDGNILVQTYS